MSSPLRNLIIILFFLSACTFLQRDDVDDPVLARVYDKYLLSSQVIPVLPKNITGSDSIAFIRNYVEKWIQQQVLLHEAQSILTAGEQDFARQLEEYRNSLMLFTLERKLVQQYLDTVVDDNAIKAYYEENKEQFELRGNIVKFDYIKIPVKSKQLKDFRRLMQSERPSDSALLEDYSRKYSTDYWFARDWVFLNDMLGEVPIELENQENFLRRTKYTEKKDSLFWYLLRINDFKTTDSVPPLAFEADNIRNIIINSRKLKILDDKKKEITSNAYAIKEAETFYGPPVK